MEVPERSLNEYIYKWLIGPDVSLRGVEVMTTLRRRCGMPDIMAILQAMSLSGGVDDQALFQLVTVARILGVEHWSLYSHEERRQWLDRLIRVYISPATPRTVQRQALHTLVSFLFLWGQESTEPSMGDLVHSISATADMSDLHRRTWLSGLFGCLSSFLESRASTSIASHALGWSDALKDMRTDHAAAVQRIRDMHSALDRVDATVRAHTLRANASLVPLCAHLLREMWSVSSVESPGGPGLVEALLQWALSVSECLGPSVVAPMLAPIAQSGETATVFVRLAEQDRCKLFGLLVLLIDVSEDAARMPSGELVQLIRTLGDRLHAVLQTGAAEVCRRECPKALQGWLRAASILVQSPACTAVWPEGMLSLASALTDWLCRGYVHLFEHQSSLDFDVDEGWMGLTFAAFLVAWIAQPSESLAQGVLHTILHCRLRLLSTEGGSGTYAASCNGAYVEEDDLYGNFLIHIGLLARRVPSFALEALATHLSEIFQHMNELASSDNRAHGATQNWERVYEQLHWGTMITSHVLYGALEPPKRSPFLQADVHQLWSSSFERCIALLQMVASFQESLPQRVAGREPLSPLLWTTMLKFWRCTVVTLFRAAALERASARAHEAGGVPSVVLDYFGNANQPLPQALTAMIMRLCADVLQHWPYEPALMAETLALLEALGSSEMAATIPAESVAEQWRELLALPEALTRLPPKFVGDVVKSLVHFGCEDLTPLMTAAAELAHNVQNRLCALCENVSLAPLDVSSVRMVEVLACIEVLRGTFSDPHMGAHADEALEALWPRLGPMVQSACQGSPTNRLTTSISRLLATVAIRHGSALGKFGRARRHALLTMSFMLFRWQFGGSETRSTSPHSQETWRAFKWALRLMHSIACSISQKDDISTWGELLVALNRVTPFLTVHELGIARIQETLLAIVLRVCTDQPELAVDRMDVLFGVLEYCFERSTQSANLRDALEAIEAVFAGNGARLRSMTESTPAVEFFGRLARLLLGLFFHTMLPSQLLPDLCSATVEMARSCDWVAPLALEHLRTSPRRLHHPLLDDALATFIDIVQSKCHDEGAVECLLHFASTNHRLLPLCFLQS